MSPRRGGPRQGLKGWPPQKHNPIISHHAGAQSATADTVGELARHRSEAKMAQPRPPKRGTEAKLRGGFPPQGTIPSPRTFPGAQSAPADTVGVIARHQSEARQGASVGGATRKRLHPDLPKHPQKPSQAGLSCSNLRRNLKIDGFGTSKTPSSRVSLGQL